MSADRAEMHRTIHVYLMRYAGKTVITRKPTATYKVWYVHEDGEGNERHRSEPRYLLPDDEYQVCQDIEFDGLGGHAHVNYVLHMQQEPPPVERAEP